MDPEEYTCSKCRLAALLEEKVRGLEEEGSTLCQIQTSEEFLDKTPTELPERQEPADTTSNTENNETSTGKDSVEMSDCQEKESQKASHH